MSQRTATIDLDSEFAYHGEVTKSWTDAKTGERYIRGVASGIEVDRDGERVSKNAIASMARQVAAGGVKIVGGTHQQDWSTEMGDVVKATHDTDHDQLLVECKLPPEGEDHLADKAWTRMTKHGEKLAFSIGGKLRKAYFEVGEGVGKRVKVLDEILLRHVALTKNPAYSQSFAEAVAKTFDVDAEGLEFTEVDDEPVAKAATPNGDDSDTGDRDAGQAPEGNQKDADQPGNEAEEKDDEDTGTEPDAVRHLACPNCGHEFAAPLPEEDTETNPSQDLDQGDDDKTTDDRASKIAQENDPMDDTLKMLKALVGEEEAPVEKTEDAPAAEEVVEVAKTEDLTIDDVAKMVAASHRAKTEAIETLTEKVNEVLSVVAKSLVGLNDKVDSLPVGRKSIARVLPPKSEVEKTASENDSVEKRIADAPDAVAALKIANEAQYGIS